MSREVIIQRIEKSDLIDAKKELMIDLVNSKKEDNFDKKVDRLYRQFSKSSTFKKHAEKMVVRDDEKPVDNVVPMIKVLEAKPVGIPYWAFEQGLVVAPTHEMPIQASNDETASTDRVPSIAL